MQMTRPVLLLMAMLAFLFSYTQQYNLPKQNDRWKIQTDGSIDWVIDNRLPHNDHIEMGGEKVALWMQYGVDTNGKALLNRSLVFPTHRLLPQRTIAHMTYDVKDEELPRFIINDRLFKTGVFNAAVQRDMPEKVISIRHRGIMEIVCELGKDRSVQLKRTLFPSVKNPMAVEKFVFTNQGKQAAKIEMEYMRRESAPAEKRTTGGPHHFIVSTINHGEKTVQPGDSVVFIVSYQATKGNEQPLIADVDLEEKLRKERITAILSKLVLETPDTILNTMFSFARIRATESI